MDANTISELNALNLAFYRTTASHFNDTRQQAWEGWRGLIRHLETPLSVLDVGCGNGRFGLFLHEQLGNGISYHGIDSDAKLLDYAAETLRKTTISVRLTQRDIIEQPLSSADESYNLVVAFGVVHHIPGLHNRQQLMVQLANQVTDNGLLMFACWRFLDVESLAKRVVPWPQHLQREANDYLLDWRRGETALRYCHYVDDTEHDALVAATKLQELERYRADGRNSALNQYSILQR